jgi:2-keto-3-deoxy-L-rhamnonate aldolase RhmA
MSLLKKRLASGELLIGTWVKTPHPTIVEVLSLTSLDCLVLDAEHAPFDRAQLDTCLSVAREMPVLVRTASAAHEHILQALDSGAAGVIVPHLRSASEAEAAVRASRYVRGGRGYAGTPRAAGFGTRGMTANRAAAENVIVIGQVEDVEAIDAIDEIAAVEGIDALFVGRADLTVSFGVESPDDPIVVGAVERVCSAGKAAGRTIGMFLARPADAQQWLAKGASLFLLQSDHDFLRSGAEALVASVRTDQEDGRSGAP